MSTPACSVPVVRALHPSSTSADSDTSSPARADRRADRRTT
ncbi:hypothetical protein [Streptomyces sp. NPDC054783]